MQTINRNATRAPQSRNTACGAANFTDLTSAFHAPATPSRRVYSSTSSRRTLRQPEVEALTGIKRKSMYALIARKKFPPGKPLWEGSRAVGWDSLVIEAFMNGAWKPEE